MAMEKLQFLLQDSLIAMTWRLQYPQPLYAEFGVPHDSKANKNTKKQKTPTLEFWVSQQVCLKTGSVTASPASILGKEGLTWLELSKLNSFVLSMKLVPGLEVQAAVAQNNLFPAECSDQGCWVALRMWKKRLWASFISLHMRATAVSLLVIFGVCC